MCELNSPNDESNATLLADDDSQIWSRSQGTGYDTKSPLDRDRCRVRDCDRIYWTLHLKAKIPGYIHVCTLNEIWIKLPARPLRYSLRHFTKIKDNGLESWLIDLRQILCNKISPLLNTSVSIKKDMSSKPPYHSPQTTLTKRRTVNDSKRRRGGSKETNTLPLLSTPSLNVLEKLATKGSSNIRVKKFY